MIHPLLLSLSLLAALAGPAFAEDKPADTTQTWPPPELKTKPPPVTLEQLRSGKAFGIGLNVGSRTGLTLKIWPKRPHGITLDAGATNFSNSVSFVLGYAFHAKPIRGPNGISASFYVGAGFRTRLLIFTEPDPDDEDRNLVRVAAVLGARIPFGLSFLMSGFPVELFVEAAPAIDFWQSFGVDVEGIGGVRVYF
ncbi:MAG: hypothetical protein GY898_02115 [Proteobacteria bacterium]|nr:hypothetical protein [Pseudomonadota bacterium]